jgi:hypothetical protein
MFHAQPQQPQRVTSRLPSKDPSGKHTKNDGKNRHAMKMGKSTISMDHFP